MSSFTGSQSYDLPLRPKIHFKTKDGLDTNYTFDPFVSTPAINVIHCDVDRAAGETGAVNILIEDSARNIDETKIGKGKKVVIQIAKSQADYAQDWSYFLVAYVRGLRKSRPETGHLLYELRALGTKVIFNERQVNMKKATESNSSAFLLKNLIKSLIEDKKSYPFKGPTIKTQIGLNTSGISPKLTQFVSKVNFELLEAGAAMDRLADIAGARWFVDFPGGLEVLTVAYPIDFHSGVTLKSGDLSNKLADAADSTSYFYGAWDSDSDIATTAGFANRLITKTQIDRKSIASNSTNQGSTSLANKALAVKAKVFETRIHDLAFKLSKVGDPESPNDRVNGIMVVDENNKPTGPTLASFKIPLGDIKSNPETIFVNDINVRSRFLDAGDFIWLILYQRSGKVGDPNNDEANTIRWHHNADTVTTTENVSVTAAGGDRDQALTWNYLVAADKGPTFNFSIFSQIRHIQEVSDRASIAEYGLIEAQIDTSFLEDSTLINLYLESLLQFTSRPRVVFNVNAVKCPNNMLFKPYQVVTIQDTLAYPSGIDCEIQRARYVFDSQSDFAIGSRFVEITPMGFEDFLAARLKCG